MISYYGIMVANHYPGWWATHQPLILIWFSQLSVISTIWIFSPSDQSAFDSVNWLLSQPFEFFPHLIDQSGLFNIFNNSHMLHTVTRTPCSGSSIFSFLEEILLRESAIKLSFCIFFSENWVVFIQSIATKCTLNGVEFHLLANPACL